MAKRGMRDNGHIFLETIALTTRLKLPVWTKPPSGLHETDSFTAAVYAVS